MHFDPRKPVCDGILFSDLYRLKSLGDQNVLAARGLVFMTEFPPPDEMFSGDIIAASREAAEEIAFGRGLGEKIVGQIQSVFEPLV